MASKEKVKRKKEKGHRLSFGRKKSKASHKQQQPHPDEEDDVAGSQLSVRSASKENIQDNTGQDPDTRHEDGQTLHPELDRPKSNTSETRKTSSDHIDQKLGSTSKSGDPERRASSPTFKKNVIIPTGGETRSVMGSAVSLKSNVSHSSLKEAWVEQKDIPKDSRNLKQKGNETVVTRFTPQSIPSQAIKPAPQTNTRASLFGVRDKLASHRAAHGLSGIQVEAEQDSPEKHAYIPYLYARNCIAKIMEDMKHQKSNHIMIVENIQTHYTTIEDETQQQFNMFVLCMRQDYQEKRKAFRQIMDVHKVELEEKERYWNEMLTSLAERNNKLLREKKVILTTSKTEIEKLEKENAKITKDFTEKLDKMALAPVPGSTDDTVHKVKNKAVLGSTQETCAVHEVSNKDVLCSTEEAHTVNKVSNKDLGSAEVTHTEVKNKTDLGSSQETGTVHEVNSKNPQQNLQLSVPAEKKKWEEERKILHDQLETEKAKVIQLEEKIMNMPVTQATARMETATVEGKENSAAPTGGIIAAGAIAMTNKNNRELERERRDMVEERSQLDEERRKFAEEREGFGDERKKWLDEINRLQLQLGDKEMVDSEWKTKYETVKDRLDDAAQTQAKYLVLQSQYEALAALVKDSDTGNAVQEQLEKTKGEKLMMTEEKQNMERDIQKWEKDFENKHKRKPTQDDMSDSVKEMYTSHSELEYMVTSLEKKEETLAKVESGKIPDPPEVVPVPIDTKDPEIITVQVKVPDPEIVKELERCHEEITVVQTEVTTLQETISSLKTEISQQNTELAQQRSKIAELEAQLATVQAGGGVVAPLTLPGSTVSDEEMEALKKENRELRKDMKKMIKQYQRMADRKKELGEDEDQTEHDKEIDKQLGDLDNKIADLEAENEALKEERTLLKERVRTITETITITQTHSDTDKKLLQDRDNLIEELRQDLEKKKLEIIAMHKDMKKMIKSHEKLRVKADDLAGSQKAVRMLEIVAMLIHEIHGEVPDAARKVNIKLEEYETQMGIVTQVLESKQQAYAQWADRYLKKHGAEPLKTDRDKEGTQLHDSWEGTKKDYKEKALHYAAIQLIKTGDVTKVVDKEGTVTAKAELEVDHLEKQLQSADNKLIEIESENETMKLNAEKLQQQNKDLEEQIELMRKQLEMQAAVLTDTESSAELTQQLSELQKKTDQYETELMQEKLAHVNTREELESLRKQFVVAKDEADNEKEAVMAQIESEKVREEAEKAALRDEIAALKGRAEALEEERLSNLPPDTAQEIRELQDKLKTLEQEKTSSRTSSVTLNAQIAEFRTKLDVCSKNLETQRALNRELEAKIKSGRLDKEKEAKKMSRHMEEKENKRAQEDKQRINMLVKRVKELEAKAGKGLAVVAAGAAGGEIGGPQAAVMKRELQEQAARIKQLEAELKQAEKSGLTGAISADKSKGKQEKILKELEKKMTWEKDKADKLLEGLKEVDEENKTLKKKVDEKDKDLVKVKGELKALTIAAKDGVEAAAKVKTLEAENKKMTDENAVLTKNFESERVLRKKYYNMVEDMKGKIRVYCRSRPLSSDELARGNKSVVKSVDEYSIAVSSQRGLKEFQYDQVFMEDSTQEKIFEDTNNLIQSAVDGYNVCIFAYGQTGSGKTFTMIGDRDQKYPGIAPRAFNRIFELIHELRNKFKITVQAYMLELYNDKLIDLFAKPGTSDDEKLEIKKDKKGMVYIQGAVIKDARNAKELFALFEEGSINRHTASTKMNAESSRSHLIIGIVMESTNKNTGNITKGKLSLVDLAGSERVGKTGATADQLKEAMSINKSLSALGDVISALSSEQQFIPYRNHKLTMLMQDSLGGNAKTLMFVNISPADYNCDETVISLTYASRVKLITNDASKNADNKEIARLKMVIDKMRKGEQVEEEQ